MAEWERRGGEMAERWQADPSAAFRRRLGAAVSGRTGPPCADDETCPDVWELDNGDVAVIGRDLTAQYASRLPEGVRVGADERLVVIPGGLVRGPEVDPR
ncbi:hypothetical protein JOF41_005174 [Saccharothrix coeruleofusca]|uniref:hypothetical protein n=1 Tax=Saccharothrix coeruleofusca TaxID=33919 RepID=UPI0027DE84D2|nr:hypothetical protein [Saccharothrix coeruleofusca]MBP2338996.1 hypothetical protein [Saccharothrix coeruleofusca]